MKAQNFFKKLYLIIALAYWPCICILPFHFTLKSHIMAVWIILTAFIFLPFYVIYMEAGCFLGRRRDGKIRSEGEMKCGNVTSILTLVLVLFAVPLPILNRLEVKAPLFSDLRESLNQIVVYCGIPTLILSVIIPILWIIFAIVFKKRLRVKELLSPKSVWIPALGIVLATAVGALIVSFI